MNGAMTTSKVSKFRKDNDHTDALGGSLGELVQRALELIGHENIFISCCTCRAWVEGQGCGKFQKLPPVKVIVTGCEAYDDNYEIPF